MRGTGRERGVNIRGREKMYLSLSEEKNEVKAGTIEKY